MEEDLFGAIEALEKQGDSSNDVSAGGDEMESQIEMLKIINPDFENSKEYQDLIASKETKKSAQAQKDVKSDESDVDNEDDDEDYSDDDEDEEENDDEDVFGLTKSTKKQSQLKVNFEAPKEMLEFIGKNFGVKDTDKFFNSVATWRNQAQEGERIKKEHNALLADFDAMPPELKQSVILYARGEDYTKPFLVNQRLDYSKGFERQDPERLVQHYLEDQYDRLKEKLASEDISNEEYRDKIELLASSAEKLFNKDKQALEKERDDFEKRQQNEYRELKRTANISVEKLSKSYPNFRNNELNKVRSILINGSLDDLFYNEDGTYNEDAAERIAFALYGGKMKSTIEKIAKNKGESEANQRLVDSSPKTLKKSKGSSDGVKPDLSAISHFAGVKRSNPYD